MRHITILSLLLLFLISSSAAVPTSRSLRSVSEDPTIVQDFAVEDARDVKESDFERLFEGRMDLENTDYPGTGANNHHDPKPPGQA